MSTIEVRTQAELDAAITTLRPGQIITCVGDGYFVFGGSATVRAWGSATVRAWGSATVEASGSATVRASGSATVRAWDSATVRASGSATVRAWGSATVRASGSATVRAWGSATVRAWGSATVEASDSATVRAWGSATVRASKYVAVTVDRGAGSKAKVQGGVLIEIPPIDSIEAWCDYHGVEIVDGIATLYKAVDDDYATDRSRQKGIAYTPGSAPEAPDWDGGKVECGGGLHFSARPVIARRFNESATRYVACPVAVAGITVKPEWDRNKVKAPRVAGPCVEVDIDGESVAASKPKRTRKAAAS